MKAVGVCPICKIKLCINSKDSIRFCKTCRREFYQIEEQKSKLQLEYEDLETVSSESGGEGPVLLSDQTDYRGFPSEYEYKKKKQSYLTDYFGSHVSVETREYIPT